MSARVAAVLLLLAAAALPTATAASVCVPSLATCAGYRFDKPTSDTACGNVILQSDLVSHSQAGCLPDPCAPLSACGLFQPVWDQLGKT